MAATRTCEFTVTGQSIRYASRNPLPVGDTQGYLIARFALDGDWDGLTVEAVFMSPGFMRSVPLDESGCCLFPAALLAAPCRSLRVGLIGRGSDGYRLTTDTAEVRLRRSCMPSAAPVRTAVTTPGIVWPPSGDDSGSSGDSGNTPDTPDAPTVTAPTLAYTRTATAAGHAAGTVTLTSRSAASTDYAIRWGNASGALAGYDPIRTATLAGVGQSASHSFTAHNAIPAGATRIVAVDGSGRIAASVDVPVAARLDGSPTYSFGLMADPHIDGQWDAGSSQGDFARALAYFNAKGVAMSIIAGDVTADGYTADFTKYAELAEASNAPIYACTGNHDLVNDAAADATLWSTHVGAQGKNFTVTHDGDVFIFLGLESDLHSLSSATTAYLETRLEANKAARVFIIEHIYVNPVGNIGALDSGSEGQNSNAELMRILAAYPGATLITGHSHIEFALQRLGDNANCALATASMCHRIHVPSTAQPRKNDVDDPDTADYTYKYAAGSQAYLVDVYPDCTVYRGVDFEGCADGVGRLLPIAQYIIPKSAASDATVAPPTEAEEGYTLVSDIAGITMEPGSLEGNGSFSDSSDPTSQRAYFIPIDRSVATPTVKAPIGMLALRVCYYTAADASGATGAFDEFQDGNFTAATQYCTLTAIPASATHVALKIKTNNVGAVGDVQVNFAGDGSGSGGGTTDPDPDPPTVDPDPPTVDEGYMLVSDVPGITTEAGSLEGDGSFSDSSSSYRAYFIPIDHSVAAPTVKAPIGMLALRVCYYTAADVSGATGEYDEFQSGDFTEATQYCALSNIPAAATHAALKIKPNGKGSVGDVQINFCAQTT